MLGSGCLLLEKVKNRETRVAERKAGLFRMPAFWEDGRLVSKGHLPALRTGRRFYRYTRRRTKEKGESFRQVPGLTSFLGSGLFEDYVISRLWT